MSRAKISKSEALSFLLTYIVVDQSTELALNQLSLFKLSSLAQEAADHINTEEGVIPHEVIESIARTYLESL